MYFKKTSVVHGIDTSYKAFFCGGIEFELYLRLKTPLAFSRLQSVAHAVPHTKPPACVSKYNIKRIHPFRGFHLLLFNASESWRI